MATFTRDGYGQVEPNQLSGIKTGQIFASLPLAKDVNVLQQGEFMYYDYAAGYVSAEDSKTTGLEPYMVYQEIKIYEPWLSYKDFAMIRVGDNYVTHRPFTGAYGDGAETKGATLPQHSEYGYRMEGIAPRLVKTNIGDIWTTNMVTTGVEYQKGDILKLKKSDRNTLVFDKTGDIETVQVVVAKVYTMPDGQPGLKVQRVK